MTTAAAKKEEKKKRKKQDRVRKRFLCLPTCVRKRIDQHFLCTKKHIYTRYTLGALDRLNGEQNRL